MRVVRVRPSKTVLDWYHRQIAAPKPETAPTVEPERQETTSFRSELKRHVRFLFEIPDYCRGWYRPALKQASKIIPNCNIDVVFSSGPPWISHSVAYSLSRRYNLPWFADFRDAWASDPWRRFAYNRGGTPKWRDLIDKWIEARWIRQATLIICTTQQQRDSLLQFHSQLDPKRIIVVSNGLADMTTNFHAPTTLQKGPRILVHAGSLYGGRSIDTFCQAVSSLVRSGRISPNDVRVMLIGEVDPNIKNAAFHSTPDLFENGMISFYPRTDWVKLQEILWQADVLLIFQGDHSTAIPAKFFEYLKTGKPILASTSDGALRDIVISTGSGFVTAPDQEEEIASTILQALKAKPRAPEEVNQIVKNYDFRYLTAELAANMRRILADSQQ
jgi:glycosyltransferase involved in cell wall biosynthesis